ncbi:UDP-glucose 4-epimerase GalE [Myxococcota bacterium]|nr:UDP-glucose 4-epimerase GalE [Myxococcota bacterium]
MRILVTGGAGYIGSHMVRTLASRRHDVVVVDDLSSGHRDVLAPEVPLHQLDIRDRDAITALLVDEQIDAIFHFASRIQVGESVVAPRLYYRDNFVATLALLDAALDAHVRRFVFSSTAAVYGDPIDVPLTEEHPTAPVNPYGETKLWLEHVLEAYGRAYGLGWVALRYFNAAGADVASGLGERHEPESHLIPIVLDAALGIRPSVTIYGDDYPTPDGTCVRDYIHVMDLAEAHLAALEYLDRGGESGAFNLGTGVGHSVREVIDVARGVSGRPIDAIVGPRRAGDPPELVASPKRAIETLGWVPTRTSLDQIIGDAWQWQSSTTYRALRDRIHRSGSGA